MISSVATLPIGLLVGTTAAHVNHAAPCARLSLRARGDISALNRAIGLELPSKIGTRTTKNGVEALRLGPDEWVILAPDAVPIITACANVYDSLPHSLVDISNREVTFEIGGPKATALIEIGCPRDPESIKIGEARRTVFDGASVVLWRDGETSYRMDAWNSFMPHLLHLLEIGCRELAAETH